MADIPPMTEILREEVATSRYLGAAQGKLDRGTTEVLAAATNEVLEEGKNGSPLTAVVELVKFLLENGFGHSDITNLRDFLKSDS